MSIRLTFALALALALALPAAEAGAQPTAAAIAAARIGLARTARDLGRYDEAAGHFRAAHQASPLDTGLLVEYFWVAHRVDAAVARSLGEEILRKSPRNRAVREGLVGLLVDAGDERAVRAEALTGHQLEPAAAVWPRRLAESYLRSRDGVRAAEYFAKAASLSTEPANDRAMRALALESTTDKAAALGAWDELGTRVWSSRPDWAASRARALSAVSAPAAVTPSRPAPKAAAHPTRAIPNRCVTAPLAELEARGDAAGLVGAAAKRDPVCADQPEWTARGIEVAIGRGQFAEALRLVEPLAAAAGAPLRLREQYGVVLHWTGDDQRAEPVLRAVVAEAPHNLRAIDALVEVLRASGRPADAWQFAQRREALTPGALETRLLLASLALETGQADEALRRARALESLPDAAARARGIAGGALLALGSPAEARAQVHELTAEPGAAAVWLEATAALDGANAALHAAQSVAGGSGHAWADVIAKRARWHALVGDLTAADRLIALLAGLDAPRAALAKGEVALALGQPAEAADALRPLVDDRALGLRAKDMLSVALAEQGRWDDAQALVADVKRQRPHDAALTLREAAWQSRRTPSSATLEALERAVGAGGNVTDGAAVLARAYMKAGRYADALNTLPEDSAAPVDAQVLRAQLAAALGQRDTADALLSSLTARTHADPSWYLAWADLHANVVDARRVLNLATARFPEHALLQERAAQAAWAAGDRPGAERAAALAVARDAGRTGAWFVSVAAAGDPARVDDLARRFEQQFADSPTALLGMGDMLAGLTRSTGQAPALRALGWTTRVRAAYPAMEAAAVSTQVRLLMALGRYAAAEEEVEALLVRLGDTPEKSALRTGPGSLPPPVRKLRAELYMQLGDYDRAVAAYDDYLSVAPDDVAAGRQRARIEGWRGNTGAALAHYAALRGSAPGVPAIEAEAAAKGAYYGGRWNEAVAHYDAWLALEPRESEARLERAQSLDHLGDTSLALQAYLALAEEHTTAAAAAERIRRRRSPSVEVFTQAASADGVSRRQVLETIDAGAALSTALGAGYGTRLRLHGGSTFVSGGDREWTGTTVGAELVAGATSPFGALARLGYRALDGVTPHWFGDARVSLRPGNRFSAELGAERSVILENAETVEARLAGTGPVVALRWQPGSFTADVRGSYLLMNDDNHRRVVRLDLAQQLIRRKHELRLIGSTEHSAFDNPSETYFAPASFWRHDAGVEWRGWLRTPKFFGDREQWISAAYLYGGDDRRERYHTARVGFAYEVAGGMSVVAGGDLVRSRVYDGTRLTLGLRLKQVPSPGR